MAQDMNEMTNSSYDGYEGNSFSLALYDDRLQTVPDLEPCTTTIQPQSFYQAQEVPDYNVQFSFNEETTPVKIEQLYLKANKITRVALNFAEDANTKFEADYGECRKEEVTKRKKSKRRSYLSSDLPAEIRNQRRTVANARERARVGRMANGYNALQKSLPKYLTDPKMRKVDILNSALCHIQNLMNMLSGKSLDCNQNVNSEITEPFAERSLQFQQQQFQIDFNSNCLSQFIQGGMESDQFAHNFR